MSLNLDKALAIPGWMSESELEWLANEAQYYDTIVEVGSYLGRSTRALLDNSSGTVYAVDSWKNDWSNQIKARDPEAYELIQKYPNPYVEFRMNVIDHLNKRLVIFPYEFRYFVIRPINGMIFIDASHIYRNVKRDIEQTIHMNPEGLICGHDYDSDKWPDVKRAVDEIFPNVQVHETIWWWKYE